MPRAQRGFGDLVARTLDSVVNGVSQQPPTVRLPSQCEEQINLWSRVSEGATRRPPTEFVSTLHTSALPTAGYKAHVRYRDANTQHMVLIEDGDIRVWNMLTGVEATILGTNAYKFYSEDTSVITDQTTASQNDTANDLILIAGPEEDSGFYIGMQHKFDSFEISVTTAGTGTYTVGFEYSQGSGAWGQMSSYGLATAERYKTVETVTESFTRPTDWARNTVNGVEAYWIRSWWSAGTMIITPLGGRVRINNKTYLDIAGTSATDAFAITSVADNSFIVNKETTVAQSGLTTAAREDEFILYMHESSVGTPYQWIQTLGSVTFNTPDFNPSGTTADITPGEVVEDLLTQVYNTTNFPNWSFERIGTTVLHGWQSTGTGEACPPPSWEYTDEIYSYHNERTQKFSDLPPIAPDGFKTEITGEDGNEDNNYWVTFNNNENAWIETVGDGLDNGFDASTMPHALIQVSVGGGGSGEDEFTFGPIDWAERGAGDADSAPAPTFVGETISDIFFHKNRLGLVAGEHIVLSETGQYYNFWPTTVTTLVDSDPIDTAGTNNRVAPIDFAVPFDEKLFLFSSIGGLQNMLRAAGNATVGLTNANAEIVEASAYPVSSECHPVAIGREILYVVDRGVSSSVFEYSTRNDTALSDENTSHIPTYVPGGIKHIAACPRENIALLYSADDTDALYAYSWFWNGGDKVQKSWSRWQFHSSYDIKHVEFVESVAYLLVKRTSGLHLEKMNFAKLTDGDWDHRVYYDSMQEVTGVYTAADNITRFTMSADPDPAIYGTYRAVLTGVDFGDELGRSIPLSYEDATEKLYTYGDFSTDSVHIGRVVPWEYEFTKPILQVADSSAGATVATTQGRLQINKYKVLVRNAGGFEAVVVSEEANPDEITVAEEEYVYAYPDKITHGGLIGVANPREDDQFSFDVGIEARYAKVKVQGQSHLPFTLTGAEWEGWLSIRSNRA